jgi:hypothetical protein
LIRSEQGDNGKCFSLQPSEGSQPLPERYAPALTAVVELGMAEDTDTVYSNWVIRDWFPLETHTEAKKVKH